MSSANVKSIDALSEMRGSLAQFRADAQSALDSAAMEIQRTQDWLQERLAYWQNQVRQCEAAVKKASAALTACEAATRNNGLACAPLAVALQRAQARLRAAEGELHTVLQAKRAVDEAVATYRRAAYQLVTALDSDVVKASAMLSHTIEKLQAYLSMSASSGVGLSEGVNQSAQNAAASDPKIHYHHTYPKFRGNDKYSSFFEEMGIDVDRWTVAVDEKTHLKYIHGETEWNEIWKAWIDEHRGEVTAEEVHEFGRKMLTSNGLEGLWEGDANPIPSYDVPEDEIHRRPPQ